MVLTEEQQEKIRQNREAALERQRKRKEELERQEAAEHEKKQKRTRKAKEGEAEDAELEQFEEGASEYVTKKEAMSMYCLPEGTLAVCAFTEKANPHHQGWVPMKLYDRSEIRRRARERWGGMEGLIAERQRRQEKKFQKDLEKTKDLFKSKR